MKGVPRRTQLELIFDVPAPVVNAAADELVNVLNATFQKIHRERKLDGRVSLAIARAVTAKMYMTLTAYEQAHLDEFSKALIKRLNFLVVPGGVNLDRDVSGTFQ